MDNNTIYNEIMKGLDKELELKIIKANKFSSPIIILSLITFITYQSLNVNQPENYLIREIRHEINFRNLLESRIDESYKLLEDKTNPEIIENLYKDIYFVGNNLISSNKRLSELVNSKEYKQYLDGPEHKKFLIQKTNNLLHSYLYSSLLAVTGILTYFGITFKARKNRRKAIELAEKKYLAKKI